MSLGDKTHCNWCGIAFQNDRFLRMHFEPPGCPVRNRCEAMEAQRPKLEGDWRDVRRRIPFADHADAVRLLLGQSCEVEGCGHTPSILSGICEFHESPSGQKVPQ